MGSFGMLANALVYCAESFDPRWLNTSSRQFGLVLAAMADHAPNQIPVFVGGKDLAVAEPDAASFAQAAAGKFTRSKIVLSILSDSNHYQAFEAMSEVGSPVFRAIEELLRRDHRV